mmetsp:Transcript_49100/g.56600  ORF Transcript_49100/g.56600 Transcript_49100/m.56600 type:complete len:117 (-) Transcript_49100:206-556(-)
MVSSYSNPSILASTATANTTNIAMNDSTVDENRGLLLTNNNSQRTNNTEQSYIKFLEVEQCKLWVSNAAIKFQNQYYRDMIARIQVVIRDNMNRNNIGEAAGNSSSNGVNEDNGAL